MSPERYFQIIAGRDRSLGASVARSGLWLASLGYRAITSGRNALFNLRLRKTYDLGRPAISIGNITVGGTGKTPMVIEIACRLMNMGKRPAVLLRGYHAQDGLSDEASLLADALTPHVMVHANAKRVMGAANALQSDPAIDCFLMDDAFQHRQAHRQLDLVLIDATNPFGFGHLLPRGLLRESLAGLRRAKGVILTRADLVDPAKRDAIIARVKQAAGDVPMAQVAFVWTGWRNSDGRVIDLDQLQDTRVMGVCGIGNPGAFRSMLHAHLGDQPMLALADHHAYHPAELMELFKQACDLDAKAIITTDKDWVKWREHTPHDGWSLPVYRPVMGVQWLAGEQAIDRLLEQFDAQEA